MKRLSSLGLVNLAVAAGATTPSAGTGSLIWSTTANTTLQFNGTSWQPMGAGPLITVSDTAPSSPALNDLWLDTTT